MNQLEEVIELCLIIDPKFDASIDAALSSIKVLEGIARDLNIKLVDDDDEDPPSSPPQRLTSPFKNLELNSLTQPLGRPILSVGPSGIGGEYQNEM